jgi:hypothetical protein
MKNINLKYALFAIIGVSILVFFGLIFVFKIDEITFIKTIKLLPKVVTIDLILIAIFSSFLWKLRIFKGWLVPFPNLNGTWRHYSNHLVDPKRMKDLLQSLLFLQ